MLAVQEDISLAVCLYSCMKYHINNYHKSFSEMAKIATFQFAVMIDSDPPDFEQYTFNSF